VEGLNWLHEHKFLLLVPWCSHGIINTDVPRVPVWLIGVPLRWSLSCPISIAWRVSRSPVPCPTTFSKLFAQKCIVVLYQILWFMFECRLIFLTITFLFNFWMVMFVRGILLRNPELNYYICLVYMFKCIGHLLDAERQLYYFTFSFFNHNQTVFISAWQFCFWNLDKIFKSNLLNYLVQHEYHVL